jgi:RNA-directed DNA polymerase
MQRIKTFLKEMHGVSFDVLLYHLNRKLRGWAMFNRHVVAKRLFNTLDNAVYPLVCHWLRRLHRNKTWAWIKRQYRHYRGGRYSLGTYVQTSQGERQWLGLFNMADVPIRRHVKI